MRNGGVPGYGIDQTFLRARLLLNLYHFNTLIFSFIPDDIRRCQMSEMWGAAKPYFELEDGRPTLKNVPLSPPAAPKESELLLALEHSRLVHAVMKRLLPTWWGVDSIQVQDAESGVKVACALLHELEEVTKLRGSKLMVLVQHGNWENLGESPAVESVLSCLTDPATRVLDLTTALSELKTKDPSRYDRLYKPSGGHMSAEGNHFVALEISKFLTQRAPAARQSGLSPAH